VGRHETGYESLLLQRDGRWEDYASAHDAGRVRVMAAVSGNAAPARKEGTKEQPRATRPLLFECHRQCRTRVLDLRFSLSAEPSLSLFPPLRNHVATPSSSIPRTLLGSATPQRARRLGTRSRSPCSASESAPAPALSAYYLGRCGRVERVSASCRYEKLT
jgi:hypothetical protein